MADALRARFQSGEYASESEFIRDGFRTLFARDQAADEWLRQDFANAYDALRSDLTREVTPQRLRDRLAAEHSAQA